MKTGYSGFDIFYAILGGAAAGAIVALLVAPASGKETREKLISSVRRGKRKAMTVTPALREALEHASSSARAAFEDRYRHYLAALEAEEQEKAEASNGGGQGDVAG